MRKDTRRRLQSRAPLALMVAVAALLPPAPGAGQEYRSFDELTSALRSLVSGSDLADLSAIAESHDGREIWMVTVAAPGGAAVETRPALLVVGNLEGDHVVGSELAVEAVRYLLEQNGSDEEVTRLLAENVVYVVPRLNPDGAEAMFTTPQWDRKGNGFAYDDDNDGRNGEDGPDDLNGDGLITLMRVPDASGAFFPHPDDPRLMKRADASEGETGTHAVYWEGTDDDGDGFYNEDGPGGVDLNRNFQHAYPYWQADAGKHMVSEPESRGLMDFVVANRNIAAIVTFGQTDNLVTPPNARGMVADASTLDLLAFADESFDEIHETGVYSTGGGGGFGFGFGGFGGFGDGLQLRGAQLGRDNDPSSGRRPSTTVHADDLRYYTEVSEAYRELTGIERVGVHRKPEGAFFDFGYFQYGVPSFSTPGWALPEAGADGGDGAEGAQGAEAAAGVEGGARGGGGTGQGGARSGPLDLRLLNGLEAQGVDAFVDWSPYDHPTLGEVEIGGFRPHAATNPPAERIAELGEAHGRFLARLGGMLPRVSIVETNVTAHGGGLFTVEATVQNSGYFPTALRHGVVARAVDPTMVQIQVDPEQIVTGDPKTSMIPTLAGSGTRESFSWVIRGSEGASVEIRLRAQKGGTDTATVTLR